MAHYAPAAFDVLQPKEAIMPEKHFSSFWEINWFEVVISIWPPILALVVLLTISALIGPEEDQPNSRETDDKKSKE